MLFLGQNRKDRNSYQKPFTGRREEIRQKLIRVMNKKPYEVKYQSKKTGCYYRKVKNLNLGKIAR